MITKSQTGYIQNAIYISYTSLSDFLKCPRAYYLKNIYRDPKSGFRLQVASPYLSLGSTVHDSVKWFLDLKGQVTEKQLEDKFRNLWLKYREKKGGFESREQEADFGKRGISMLENFYRNYQVLEKKASEITFPKYNLVDNVVLIGNFDYVGEKEDGTLQIVDFKTGANNEDDATQLYIYAILAEANLGKSVSSASFWYLDRDDKPKDIVLDSLEPKLKWFVEKAGELKEVREKDVWVCIKDIEGTGENLCRDCRDYQDILGGKGEFMFSDYRYKKDIYYLNR